MSPEKCEFYISIAVSSSVFTLAGQRESRGAPVRFVRLLDRRASKGAKKRKFHFSLVEKKEGPMRYLARCLAAAALVVGLLGGSTVWGDHHEGAKVNINTADAAALETLPGIGPAKAKAVIDYREKNGAFKTIDDLKNVSGIGDKTLEGLRDKVTVGEE
jgi:comEA protein